MVYSLMIGDEVVGMDSWALLARNDSSASCGENRSEYTHLAYISHVKAKSLVEGHVAEWEKGMDPKQPCPTCGKPK